MKAHVAEVLSTNRDLAASQRLSQLQDKSFAMTSIPAFNSEDLTAAMDEYGRITRRDMFKGYTAEQRHRIMMDNEEVIRMRREALYSEKRDNDNWVLMQLAQTRAMEQALYEERRLREEMEAEQMATLRGQVADADERKRIERRDRFGGIGEEFFDGFGRDCR
jgi:RIB43A